MKLYGGFQQQAFDLLTSGKAREAFAIDNNLPPTTSAHDIDIRFSTLEGFTATVDLYSAQLGSGCKVIGTAVGG